MLFDFAFVHQHHTVGDFERFFLIMRDKDTGDVQFIMQLAQPATKFFSDLSASPMPHALRDWLGVLSGDLGGKASNNRR